MREIAYTNFSTSRAPAVVYLANLCAYCAHSPSSQNTVSFCSLKQRHQAWVSWQDRYIQSSYQVCQCPIYNRALQQKRSCRYCHGRSFCAHMGPPLAASSPPCKRKLRVLCLHGFRTSGKIMETQLAKLDRSVLDLLDMVFLDGFSPAEGNSGVEGFFEPPYYEWFQFERTETGAKYRNLNECIQFISDFMEKHGPFDGIVGFSQGAYLAAALAGIQQQGLALTSIPALHFVIIISGGLLVGEHPWKGCYSKPIRCPSMHLIGENDFLKPRNEELLLNFEDPVVVWHTARHTVPRLDATSALPIKNFLEEVSTIRDQKYDYLIGRQHLVRRMHEPTLEEEQAIGSKFLQVSSTTNILKKGSI